jgi:ketosteroid isomerase-like protein
MKYIDLRSTMRGGMPVAIALLTVALCGSAQSQENQKTAPQAKQLTSLLNEFLDAAGRSDRAVFDRFFADDVVYTRSAGVTVDKAEILKNVDHRDSTGGKNKFSADDVTIHDYGTTAIVNFRLVAQSEKEGKTDTAHYRNTATFLKRDNGWQVIAWQSTKVPEPAGE